jgi:hypothetical protein
MEVLKLLEKSNCKECKLPTCLAFAAAVARGQRQLGDCPRLDQEIVEQYGGETTVHASVPQDMEEWAKVLRKTIREMDLSAAAQRIGAPFSDDVLTITVCGKPFRVHSDGTLSSEIHVHQWVVGPVLNYVIHSAGVSPSGKWISFRELKDGNTWYNFFVHQSEKPLKKVADTYPDLFNDMLHIFSGKQVENHYQSDISLVLHPLPKVPVLFCYWRPEDGLDSNLNLFFDSTASDNLHTEFIYSLTTGLVKMFEKIALRHGG